MSWASQAHRLTPAQPRPREQQHNQPVAGRAAGPQQLHPAERAYPRSPAHLSNTRDVDDTSPRTVGHRFTPPDETTVHDTIWNPTEG